MEADNVSNKKRGTYRPKTTQRPSLYTLSPDEQVEVLRRERIVLWCLSKQTEAGKQRTPKGCILEAAALFDVDPRTIRNWLFRYRNYELTSPQDQRVNALIDLPAGRHRDQRFTQEQETVAVFGYLNTKWLTLLEDGTHKLKKDLVPTIADVRRLLLRLWPELEATVTEAYLRRFLKRKEADKPALFALAREGEEFFRNHFIRRIKNDVDAPDERWQLDARFLPIYIWDGRHFYTAIVLVVIDDYSRCVLGWMVIPRKVEDGQGDLRKIDFTAREVRSLLARIMLETGRRPLMLYTDNAKIFQLLEPVLPYIADIDDLAIEITFSLPGKPQGRGKVEAIQGLINQVLCGLGGFVREEKSRKGWEDALKEARKAPKELWDLDQLRKSVQAYFDQNWNVKPVQKGRPARRALWSETPSGGLPMPPPINLARFGLAKVWDTAAMKNQGIYYRDTYYQPIEAGGHQRMTDTIGKEVTYCVLDLGEYEQMYACLDGRKFERMIRIEQVKLDTGDHVRDQRGSKRFVRNELDFGIDDLRAVLIKHGGTGELSRHAPTGEVFIVGKDTDAQGAPPVRVQAAVGTTTAASEPAKGIIAADDAAESADEPIGDDDFLQLFDRLRAERRKGG